MEQALNNPTAFIFTEQATFKLKGDGCSRDLVITSASDLEWKPAQVHVRPSCVRVLRADANVDAFTRQGGVYWRFHDQEGTLKFKEPGALVLIVREHDDMVRCYSLAYDERC